MKTVLKIILILTALITISCGNMYNDIAVEIEEYNYFLGVSQSAASGMTYVYSIEDSGSIGSQVSGKFYSGATPGCITVHPTGNFMYVSYTNRLYLDVYTISTDGVLQFKQSAGPLSNNPSAVKVHPSGKYLYCSIGTGNLIAMYRVNNDGTLTSLGTVSTIKNAVGTSPNKLTISQSGNYLYAVTSNAIVGYAINTDGTLPSIPSYEFHGTYSDGSNPYSLNYTIAIND